MGKLSLEQFSVADEVYITDGNKKPFGKKQRNLNACCLLYYYMIVVAMQQKSTSEGAPHFQAEIGQE